MRHYWGGASRMAKNSARTRVTEPFVTERHLYGAQLAGLLKEIPGSTPPAVSPPASIIPTLPAAPGPVNTSQIVDFGQTTYTIASGTYFYSDQLVLTVRGGASGY